MVLYTVELAGIVIAEKVDHYALDGLADNPANVGAVAAPLNGADPRKLELRVDGRWWYIGNPPPYIHVCERRGS